ncbi:MAG: NAD(P)H-dependent oxidoreductase [Candidatus Thermoplasmatota archaeon]|nr:NAD(P)H-dependent oxidoreductase [Candidatus Thermoplasmatota archaeon]
MKVGLFYYSKTGNTKKIASMIEQKIKANKINIDLIEIQPIKHPGFIKGAYTAYREKDLPIKNQDLDVKQYDLLILGSPVWAGKPVPFIHTFLHKSINTIGKKVAFFFTSGGELEKTRLVQDILKKWSKEKDFQMKKNMLIIQMKKGDIVSGEKRINGFIMDLFTK